MSVCPRCEARVKDWLGDDPKCAFPDGVFSGDNWNCATMGELRSYARSLDERSPQVFEDGGLAYVEDTRMALLVLPEREHQGDDGFVLLGWYKQRGRVQTARVVDALDYNARPFTLADAEHVLTRAR